MSHRDLNRMEFLPGKSIVIAEVAQAHDGSLGLAHAFIDAAAAAGADAVKFQTHIAAEESTPAEPWRTPFSPQDASRYAYWKRMEFSESQWASLANHAREKGLWFLSSPFSLAAVRLLEQVGVAAWKIGSGEITNTPMLREMVTGDRPLLLSTGMSPWAEIDSTVAAVRANGVEIVAVMQCTSEYPCPPERVGLNLLNEFRRRYSTPVGISDHSGTIYPGLAAAMLGAEVIEVHMTLSREMFGPDVPVSITPGEMRNLVDGVRFIERMNAAPVDKDVVAQGLSGLRRTFMHSVVIRRDCPKGYIVRSEDLAFKKPGTGIPAERASEIIGRKLVRPVIADQLLADDDFEPMVRNS